MDIRQERALTNNTVSLGPYPATDPKGRPVELTINPGHGHLVPRRTTGVSLGLEPVPLGLVRISGQNVTMKSTTYTLDDATDADRLTAAIEALAGATTSGTAGQYGPTGPSTRAPGRPAAERLAGLGKLVQIIAFAFAAFGLIVGATIVLATKEAVGPFGEEFRYPYLAHGIGVAIGTAMIAVVIYAIGALCIFNATAGKRIS